mgnify:FL=1
MDISRSLPRKRWTLLTAILATIAVIAALLTVPLNKASAAEPKPTDFKENTTLGSEYRKSILTGHDLTWDGLVWAGTPPKTATNKGANPNNNVGWAWCIEPGVGSPYETAFVYDKANAEILDAGQYRDIAIILARKIESAAAQGNYEAASTYRTYLVPFVARDETSKVRAATTITDYDPTYTNKKGLANFPGYNGSYEEFQELTGYKFVPRELYGPAPKLKKIPGATVPKQPADWFITIVRPKRDGTDDKRDAQIVMPVDQPGLPDENGGSGSKPSIKTEAEFAEDSPQDRVVNGAVVTDTVTYENLVPGKKLSLIHI